MFIPLKSEAPAKRFPITILLIIFLNIYIYYRELSLDPRAIIAYGVTPYEIWHNIDRPPFISSHVYLTLITSLFLHAGVLHLLSNSFYLWIFGSSIEDRMGHFRFIFFYLICGVAAGFAHVLLNHESTIPIIGASGAISGVLGSYFIIFPKARIKTLIFIRLFRIPAVIFLSLWVILQFLNGLCTPPEEANIAWWAHLGGFVAGFIFIRLYNIKRG